MDNTDWIKQLLMIGIGTTSLVAEKLKEVTEQWVKEGKINPDQAKTFVDDLMSGINAEQSNFEAQIERQLKNVLQDLGVPLNSSTSD